MLAALAACTHTKIAGECIYKREVVTYSTCEPEGKLEHWRIIPDQQ